jgi:hypothetical protein
MDATKIVERYMAIWNEPDETARRARVAELWSLDGAHFTSTDEAHGHDAIAETIARTFDRYIGSGGFRLQALNGADAHHQTVKFYWALVPAGGGMARAVGSDFLFLDEEGRIRADYQFIEP